MLTIKQITSYFPVHLHSKDKLRYVLREYLLYKALQFLSDTTFVKHVCFIGGTNLRLIHGINRFSEDLDFDIKNFDRKEFIGMTDSLINYFNKSGIPALAEDKVKDKKLMAFRRNIVFPGFLQEHELSAIKDEKFLMKIECQDQLVLYTPKLILISGCGTLFKFPAPPDNVLCSMKISALLKRRKGRDFYDVMFLLGKTNPDYNFLKQRVNISNASELKSAFLKVIKETDIASKAIDFKNLTLEPGENKKILFFKEFVEKYFSSL